MPKKKKLDQLESFFIRETSKLIDLYDQIRCKDPRSDVAVTSNELTIDDEIAIVKHSWAMLISYAQIYGYERFNTVSQDLEKFYSEKINV